MSDEPLFKAAWRANRAYVVDLAFRLLRDIGEAEDVVQVAFSQLLKADIEGIEDVRAWLIVVTSRLCLNRIQSAQRRREQQVDPQNLADAFDHVPALQDPADRVTLDDRVRLALVVMLERLTPAERVVFVLHDIFATPFEAIAETLGRTPAGCRQLARRARQKLQDASDGRQLDVASVEHRHVTEQFITACAGGDLGALITVLDPKVTGDSDYGPRVATGASEVASNILRYWSGQPDNFWAAPITLVSQPVGHETALLAYLRRQLTGVILLNITSERVAKIHVIGNSDTLDFLNAQLRGTKGA
jgi:RNA polymerase sigma-70 factor (ECF subfamily)